MSELRQDEQTRGRLELPRREDVNEADLELFDKAVAYWMTMMPDGVNCWQAALLHSPLFALHRAELSSLVRGAGERDNTYSHVDREFVDMVLSPYMGTNVVQEFHIPDAVAVGVRPEAIEALYARRDEDLNEDELLLATYIRQVVDGAVTDPTFDAIKERMGARGVAEYTYFITVLWSTMRQFQAFGMPDPSDEEMLEVLAAVRRGEGNTGSDWRDRIFQPESAGG